MATLPPPMPASMGEMPAMPEADGKTVCITMNPDGTFKVYMEGAESAEAMPGQPPMPEEQGSEGAQTASSMDEALDMVRQMLEGTPSEEMSVEQAFQGGFNGEQPQPGMGAKY